MVTFSKEELIEICSSITLSKSKNFKEELLNTIDFLKVWAPKFNIGKMEITILASKNMYSNEMETKEMLLYDNAHTNSVVKKEYVFLSTATLSATAYSAKNSFTKEQEENCNFLFDILYANYSKLKAFELIENNKYYDNATGSLSAIGMFKHFNELNINIEDYTCLFINIVNFKRFNQKYGFEVGNKILYNYYKELKDFFNNDEIFGRLGGDNFLCLVKNTRVDLLIARLDYTKVKITMENTEKLINMNFRAGIYYAKKGDTFANAIDKALVASNICKGIKDSNIFYFTDDFAVKFSIEQQVLSSFKKAIKNEEFVIAYQPKVDLKNKTLCGAEALVRWKKDNNYISPGNFTNILEREHLINVLDMYMFEHVCKDIREFLDSGIDPVKISVNFSRNNLKEENLYDNIVRTLDKYKIEPKYIEIEITETSMYEDAEILHPFIEKLNRKGISISVDDFGTGYSSLNFIKDYPFDIIKIDKSFVDSIKTHNERDLLFLKNILNLIKDLNMIIVAEGVETDEQLEFLEKIGCNIIQGFIFDRPLLKNDFINRLTNREYKNK